MNTLFVGDANFFYDKQIRAYIIHNHCSNTKLGHYLDLVHKPVKYNFLIVIKW